MKVLMLHNRYVQPGGEDVAFQQDATLLLDRGHEVRTIVRANTEIDTSTGSAKARLLAGTVWSWPAYWDVRRAIRDFKPDLLHVHNFLPLLSPSSYYAAWAEGVPVVQSLHNYRLICPAATLFRDGSACTDCVGRLPWPAVRHACYRGSRPASAAVAALLQVHRLLKTWQKVDAYIAVSEFVRRQVIAGGLPASKIHVKTNCVPDSDATRVGAGEFALYVGRLTREKGLGTLIRAWIAAAAEQSIDLPLKIVGTGPMESEMRALSGSSRVPIELLGPFQRQDVRRILTNARFLVCPSEWDEPMGLVAIEAMAAGVPVLASRRGGLAELIVDGNNGFLFAPGDKSDLICSARRLEDVATNLRMGREARNSYLARYTPEQNYAQLMRVYRQVQSRRSCAERVGG